MTRKYGNVTVKDFRKYERLELHRLSQQLQTTWCASGIPYL